MLSGALYRKKIIITGGMGFVGHNLVKSLVDRYDCMVVVVDNCCNSSPDRLSAYMQKIIFIETDVLNVEGYVDHLDDCDYIFHLACSQISVSGEKPEHDLEVNALSTLRILNYLKDSNPNKLARFIITSSSSIYGDINHNEAPFDENSAPNILSNYAATKLLSENYALLYAKKHNIPVTILRYSNVYGYGQSFSNEYCGVLGKFIYNALTGASLTVFGDGEQTRDFTFIEDAIDATILSAVSQDSVNEIYNISTGQEVSINSLIAILKKQVPNLAVEEHKERDIDNIKRRAVSYKKVKQQLGWKPVVDIEKGIMLTLQWYKKHLEEIL
ncbi:hypothetical protein BOQ62_19540 [Chryseobacterium sp. CH21]|uniref:NAD-dependent epimerase/dehydratase family protein n=1 Tax=Chryseobacterium sp. CH21 TaxID=713556 RepID=UPI00100A854F|nr:NAD-dependent epimerase/dehydratase family protein [Chryseobacterium sp. CH21]RXM37897.1 hypothetical protein BOQ62_19540 [Chryseobacterium sp. CH21]